MEPGQLVCFNNRRILHGRNEFSLNGGVRHLQGCYTNIDEFKSETLVNEILLNNDNSKDEDIINKNILVGNHDYKVI